MRTSQTRLVRGVGLAGATSANMLNMIGVGPFLTIPLILASMGGPQAMLGWVLGAIVAICDGLVWAELGAALPESGGPYHYLNEAFGPRRFGELMRFLFLWQVVITAPLSTASGAVGFAQYLKYLVPSLGPVEAKLVAVAVCIVATALLYRDVGGIERLSVILWIVVAGTVMWIIVSGALHFNLERVVAFPPDAFHVNAGWIAGLGGATLIAMYDFGGYNNVCFFAGEVRDPARTIPRSILLAVIGVAVVYLAMNTVILAVVPWQEAAKTETVVSTFIERLYGRGAAAFATVLVLWTAFASVFAILLGYSRVPYAAAAEGHFFSAFARLHPVKRFPYFSLLFMGFTSAIACLLNLEQLVKALIVIQIMIQFISQIVAAVLIRRNRHDIVRPFSMWAYPLPAIVAMAGWLYILLVSGWNYILAAVLLLIGGLGVFLWRAKLKGEWPSTA